MTFSCEECSIGECCIIRTELSSLKPCSSWSIGDFVTSISNGNVRIWTSFASIDDQENQWQTRNRYWKLQETFSIVVNRSVKLTIFLLGMSSFLFFNQKTKVTSMILEIITRINSFSMSFVCVFTSSLRRKVNNQIEDNFYRLFFFLI